MEALNKKNKKKASGEKPTWAVQKWALFSETYTV